MRIHDITAPLRPDLPHWPGEQGLVRHLISDLSSGDDASVSLLGLSAHAGTHIDAPNHFISDAGAIETIPLDVLMGVAVVADLSDIDGPITADDLQGVPPGTERLIAKTRNSGWSRTDTEFRPDYVAFDESAAEWCIEYGVRLLGIDYLSIEPFDGDELGYPTHHALLEDGIVVLEGLDLEGVKDGAYFLVALPLLIPESDGAPARVLLLEAPGPDT
jgi:arylformamidase